MVTELGYTAVPVAILTAVECDWDGLVAWMDDPSRISGAMSWVVSLSMAHAGGGAVPRDNRLRFTHGEGLSPKEARRIIMAAHKAHGQGKLRAIRYKPDSIVKLHAAGSVLIHWGISDACRDGCGNRCNCKNLLRDG